MLYVPTTDSIPVLDVPSAGTIRCGVRSQEQDEGKGSQAEERKVKTNRQVRASTYVVRSKHDHRCHRHLIPLPPRLPLLRHLAWVRMKA